MAAMAARGTGAAMVDFMACLKRSNYHYAWQGQVCNFPSVSVFFSRSPPRFRHLVAWSVSLAIMSAICTAGATESGRPVALEGHSPTSTSGPAGGELAFRGLPQAKPSLAMASTSTTAPAADGKLSSRLLQANPSLAMASTEPGLSETQPSSSTLTLLNDTLITSGGIVLLQSPVNPFLPYGPNDDSNQRLCYTVMYDILTVSNSSKIYYILYEYCIIDNELRPQRFSIRKADLEEVHQGSKTLAEDELITYWWPDTEAQGPALSRGFILTASNDANASMASLSGMDVTANEAYLIVSTRATNGVSAPSLASISTSNGSRVSVISPVDGGLSLNPNSTHLFLADGVVPCRILSAAVGESGLPINPGEWNTVRQFTSMLNANFGRQSFVADGRCLYVRDEFGDRVWGIDPLTSSSSSAATLVAGSELHGSDDGDGLSASFGSVLGTVTTADGCNVFAADFNNGLLRWLKLDSPCSTARQVVTVAKHASEGVRAVALHEYGGELLLYVSTSDGALWALKLNRSALHACAHAASTTEDETPPPPPPPPPPATPESLSPSSSPPSSLSSPSSISPSPQSYTESSPPPESQGLDKRQSKTSSSSQSHNLALVVGLPLSSLALVCSVICVAYFACKACRGHDVCIGRSKSLPRMTGTPPPPTTAIATTGGVSGGEGTGGVGHGGGGGGGGGEPKPVEVQRFPLAVLSHCTDGFRQSLRIGDRGAFGDVYWGLIGGNQQVAIKLMSGELTPAKRSMFEAEVNTLSRLHHANLVRLIGYCDEGKRSILVYPYFPGGSLYARLHDGEKAVPGKPLLPALTLVERMCIALQIAKGLAYLHDGADPPIIHRDIKSSNVLLGDGAGEKLRVVVADFGLATIGERVFGREHETVVKSSHMAGTFGYMAPEYVRSGIVSEKMDVYAFGVILLELLTGRKAVSLAPSGVGWLTLVNWAKALLVNRHGGQAGIMLSDFLDPCLRDEAARLALEHIVMETLRLAAECLADNYESRPAMCTLAGAIAGLLNSANIG
ncbi:hypothetical protein CBR_g23612 [Chara braunii]|uniref:Protein kinase domain-containing protein n=1 Tax=Chara braunii TaxID=69332 RepID=A0A388L511_CHABU|nr:hypothetical protein CBR_g23612 [Chara braunii]|eukprot:GBG77283.1 hypothetical protein CBR_g23612 [Chara braunii]